MANEIDFGNLDQEVRDYFGQLMNVSTGFLTDYPRYRKISESKNQGTEIGSIENGPNQHYIVKVFIHLFYTSQ